MWFGMTDRMARRFLVVMVCLLLLVITVLLLRSSSLTFSIAEEVAAMDKLEQTKQTTELALFVSDGCSGSVSSGWTTAVESLSQVSKEFSAAYSDAKTVPFEAVCIDHDRLYHVGTGGYVGRLRADMELRTAIIEYAILNVEDIKSRTGMDSNERVIAFYEFIAEAVYRGVRLGGAPCTGEPYAWGYGYNNGVCVDSQI